MNENFKVTVTYGSVEIKSWAEYKGDGTAVGMGMAIHKDKNGNITDVKVEPTGVVIRNL